MTMAHRRLMLAIGAALLVGGWGATRYADEQQQTEPRPQSGTLSLWISGDLMRVDTQVIPSRVIYGSGVVSMAVGAGLIGFAVLGPAKRKDD